MERVVLLSGLGQYGCSAVEISQSGVAIGEGDNVVQLAPIEWNLLVEKVKSGELTTFEEMVGDYGGGGCCGCED